MMVMFFVSNGMASQSNIQYSAITDVTALNDSPVIYIYHCTRTNINMFFLYSTAVTDNLSINQY